MKGTKRTIAFGAMASLAIAWGAQAKPVTITYWGLWGDPYKQVELATIARFNKLHEGRIVVKGVDMGAGQEQKVLTAMAGGVSPDCFKLDRFMTGSWAAKDVVQPLDAFIKRDKLDKAAFFNATWAENIYGGNVYGLPWNTDNRLMYYNKSLFKQVGLDAENPPATWEDLESASRRLEQFDGMKYQRVGLVPVFGNWGYIGWLYTAGGNVTDSTGRKVAWNSPEGLKAAQFMAGTVKRYGGESGINPFRDIQSGKVGMAMEGSWFNGEILKRAKTKKYEYGVATPPRPEGMEKERMTWSGGFSLCIPRGSKHPKEAWEFIKYVATNTEGQIDLGMKSNQIPALKAAAYSDRLLASDPFNRLIMDLELDARFRPVLPAGEELMKLYNDTLTNLLVKGRVSPQDALRQTAAEAQKVLDRAWARVRR